ncbi:OsmC family protein [Kordiimonas marina]|uniref:OsmC family protein n=1 Tax=Kordiimonas marina TaxID=2872312 RepID=UPI001FF48C2F|nr:OsmC family protein [Kordiimonas marina]MCJ9430581.1 OsmC family protein [Kordiimonas marina]
MSKAARVKWAGDLTFVGESPSGHAVVMDGGAANGGRDHAIRPMEMLILGMGGCSSIDVVMILKKARQKLVDCYVDIDSERADEHPKVFKKIHAHFVLTGHDLDPAHVERAVKLSMEKYCSASAQLGALAEITWDYECHPAE